MHSYKLEYTTEINFLSFIRPCRLRAWMHYKKPQQSLSVQNLERVKSPKSPAKASTNQRDFLLLMSWVYNSWITHLLCMWCWTLHSRSCVAAITISTLLGRLFTKILICAYSARRTLVRLGKKSFVPNVFCGVEVMYLFRPTMLWRGAL